MDYTWPRGEKTLPLWPLGYMWLAGQVTRFPPEMAPPIGRRAERSILHVSSACICGDSQELWRGIFQLL